MRIWPWSELAYLRRELRAVKRSCPAEAKKNNRLAARILVLDAACVKHKRQAARVKESLPHKAALAEAITDALNRALLSEAERAQSSPAHPAVTRGDEQ